MTTLENLEPCDKTCDLVLDDMAIKKQAIFDNVHHRFICNFKSCELESNTEILVFMLNGK